ncbi:MAG: PIF1 helicase [Candidatus Uhrbacteria bacterium GW2011_GWF2_41_16]|uniref:PIF1 helicase n=1 Tax=Candidatus Uhrbacteria bacterium GW2011_GWF2_41_16 TaxID=1618997 RepID=A0A0G0YBE8_9BACT|nr:MAG: PIF1 helicase [Candidatus Uhrbacteria bacterium GW2011_GWA2_41_10]KKR97612.1 MAG: PIF1 helicase [Candidatus Uhrbacteria bacterium GW2011_GWF2_41_16]
MTQAEALAILKIGKNVFLTGEPGSGKTHTVNAYISYLRSCGIEPSITASTGIAATHIGGMTIHSWSGIGIKKMLSRTELKEICERDRVARRILETNVLIIDEISMLDAATLQLVDKVCRTIRKKEQSFGGMQVVFVGDFFQLPPVSREGEAPPLYAFLSETWTWAEPLVCYLSEHHRQEEKQFLSLLRNVRTGYVTSSDKDQLLKCCQKTEAATDVPKLFPHNANVDAINTTELKKLSGESHDFVMTHEGPPALVEQLIRGCLSPDRLQLKKGAKVMFTKNDFLQGYVNGTLGDVIDFSKETGFPIVRTRSGRIIKVNPVMWAMKDGERTLASFTQLPLRLAWAITVHKSQGMSLDAAYVDLSRAFTYGQGYVAISRVRSLDGLYLGGLNDRALQVDPEILCQDTVFHRQSDETENFFTSFSENELKKIQEQFVESCGGNLLGQGMSLKKKKPKKIKESTCEQTLVLLRKGMHIMDAAKERGRTTGTILKHLEELQALGHLPVKELMHLYTREAYAIREIHEAFDLIGHEKLKLVYDRLGGSFAYDTIRLARLFYKKG